MAGRGQAGPPHAVDEESVDLYDDILQLRQPAPQRNNADAKTPAAPVIEHAPVNNTPAVNMEPQITTLREIAELREAFRQVQMETAKMKNQLGTMQTEKRELEERHVQLESGMSRLQSSAEQERKTRDKLLEDKDKQIEALRQSLQALSRQQNPGSSSTADSCVTPPASSLQPPPHAENMVAHSLTRPPLLPMPCLSAQVVNTHTRPPLLPQPTVQESFHSQSVPPRRPALLPTPLLPCQSTLPPGPSSPEPGSLSPQWNWVGGDVSPPVPSRQNSIPPTVTVHNSPPPLVRELPLLLQQPPGNHPASARANPSEPVMCGAVYSRPYQMLPFDSSYCTRIPLPTSLQPGDKRTRLFNSLQEEHRLAPHTASLACVGDKPQAAQSAKNIWDILFQKPSTTCDNKNSDTRDNSAAATCDKPAAKLSDPRLNRSKVFRRPSSPSPLSPTSGSITSVGGHANAIPLLNQRGDVPARPPPKPKSILKWPAGRTCDTTKTLRSGADLMLALKQGSCDASSSKDTSKPAVTPAEPASQCDTPALPLYGQHATEDRDCESPQSDTERGPLYIDTSTSDDDQPASRQPKSLDSLLNPWVSPSKKSRLRQTCMKVKKALALQTLKAVVKESEERAGAIVIDSEDSVGSVAEAVQSKDVLHTLLGQTESNPDSQAAAGSLVGCPGSNSESCNSKGDLNTVKPIESSLEPSDSTTTKSLSPQVLPCSDSGESPQVTSVKSPEQLIKSIKSSCEAIQMLSVQGSQGQALAEGNSGIKSGRGKQQGDNSASTMSSDGLIISNLEREQISDTKVVSSSDVSSTDITSAHDSKGDVYKQDVKIGRTRSKSKQLTKDKDRENLSKKSNCSKTTSSRKTSSRRQNSKYKSVEVAFCSADTSQDEQITSTTDTSQSKDVTSKDVSDDTNKVLPESCLTSAVRVESSALCEPSQLVDAPVLHDQTESVKGDRMENSNSDKTSNGNITAKGADFDKDVSSEDKVSSVHTISSGCDEPQRTIVITNDKEKQEKCSQKLNKQSSETNKSANQRKGTGRKRGEEKNKVKSPRRRQKVNEDKVEDKNEPGVKGLTKGFALKMDKLDVVDGKSHFMCSLVDLRVKQLGPDMHSSDTLPSDVGGKKDCVSETKQCKKRSRKSHKKASSQVILAPDPQASLQPPEPDPQASLQPQETQMHLETLETPGSQEQEETPASQEQEETPASQEPEETPASHEPEETPAIQEPQETPASQEPQETPASQEPQETPASQEPEETPASQEPEETPASQEPEETPASQEPEETPASQEPEETPASQETQVTPASQETQVTLASMESEETQTSLEVQETPASMDSQETLVNQESHETEASLEDQETPASMDSQETQASQESEETEASLEAQETQVSLEAQAIVPLTTHLPSLDKAKSTEGDKLEVLAGDPADLLVHESGSPSVPDHGTDNGGMLTPTTSPHELVARRRVCSGQFSPALKALIREVKYEKEKSVSGVAVLTSQEESGDKDQNTAMHPVATPKTPVRTPDSQSQNLIQCSPALKALLKVVSEEAEQRQLACTSKSRRKLTEFDEDMPEEITTSGTTSKMGSAKSVSGGVDRTKDVQVSSTTRDAFTKVLGESIKCKRLDVPGSSQPKIESKSSSVKAMSSNRKKGDEPSKTKHHSSEHKRREKNGNGERREHKSRNHKVKPSDRHSREKARSRELRKKSSDGEEKEKPSDQDRKVQPGGGDHREKPQDKDHREKPHGKDHREKPHDKDRREKPCDKSHDKKDHREMPHDPDHREKSGEKDHREKNHDKDHREKSGKRDHREKPHDKDHRVKAGERDHREKPHDKDHRVKAGERDHREKLHDKNHREKSGESREKPHDKDHRVKAGERGHREMPPDKDHREKSGEKDHRENASVSDQGKECRDQYLQESEGTDKETARNVGVGHLTDEDKNKSKSCHNPTSVVQLDEGQQKPAKTPGPADDDTGTGKCTTTSKTSTVRRKTSSRKACIVESDEEAESEQVNLKSTGQEAKARNVPHGKEDQETKARNVPLGKEGQETKARNVPHGKEGQETKARNVPHGKVSEVNNNSNKENHSKLHLDKSSLNVQNVKTLPASLSPVVSLGQRCDKDKQTTQNQQTCQDLGNILGLTGQKKTGIPKFRIPKKSKKQDDSDEDYVPEKVVECSQSGRRTRSTNDRLNRGHRSRAPTYSGDDKDRESASRYGSSRNRYKSGDLSDSSDDERVHMHKVNDTLRKRKRSRDRGYSSDNDAQVGVNDNSSHRSRSGYKSDHESRHRSKAMSCSLSTKEEISSAKLGLHKSAMQSTTKEKSNKEDILSKLLGSIANQRKQSSETEVSKKADTLDTDSKAEDSDRNFFSTLGQDCKHGAALLNRAMNDLEQTEPDDVTFDIALGIDQEPMTMDTGETPMAVELCSLLFNTQEDQDQEHESTTEVKSGLVNDPEKSDGAVAAGFSLPADLMAKINLLSKTMKDTQPATSGDDKNVQAVTGMPSGGDDKLTKEIDHTPSQGDENKMETAAEHLTVQSSIDVSLKTVTSLPGTTDNTAPVQKWKSRFPRDPHAKPGLGDEERVLAYLNYHHRRMVDNKICKKQKKHKKQEKAEQVPGADISDGLSSISTKEDTPVTIPEVSTHESATNVGAVVPEPLKVNHHLQNNRETLKQHKANLKVPANHNTDCTSLETRESNIQYKPTQRRSRTKSLGDSKAQKVVRLSYADYQKRKRNKSEVQNREIDNTVVQYPTEGTAETCQNPTDFVTEKGRIPTEVTVEKCQNPSEVTTEKRVIPSEVTTEKCVIPSEVTAEKSLIPSEVTTEKCLIPSEVNAVKPRSVATPVTEGAVSTCSDITQEKNICVNDNKTCKDGSHHEVEVSSVECNKSQDSDTHSDAVEAEHAAKSSLSEESMTNADIPHDSIPTIDGNLKEFSFTGFDPAKLDNTQISQLLDTPKRRIVTEQLNSTNSCSSNDTFISKALTGSNAADISISDITISAFKQFEETPKKTTHVVHSTSENLQSISETVYSSCPPGRRIANKDMGNVVMPDSDSSSHSSRQTFDTDLDLNSSASKESLDKGLLPATETDKAGNVSIRKRLEDSVLSETIVEEAVASPPRSSTSQAKPRTDDSAVVPGKLPEQAQTSQIPPVCPGNTPVNLGESSYSAKQQDSDTNKLEMPPTAVPSAPSKNDSGVTPVTRKRKQAERSPEAQEPMSSRPEKMAHLSRGVRARRIKPTPVVGSVVQHPAWASSSEKAQELLESPPVVASFKPSTDGAVVAKATTASSVDDLKNVVAEANQSTDTSKSPSSTRTASQSTSDKKSDTEIDENSSAEGEWEGVFGDRVMITGNDLDSSGSDVDYDAIVNPWQSRKSSEEEEYNINCDVYDVSEDSMGSIVDQKSAEKNRNARSGAEKSKRLRKGETQMKSVEKPLTAGSPNHAAKSSEVIEVMKNPVASNLAAEQESAIDTEGANVPSGHQDDAVMKTHDLENGSEVSSVVELISDDAKSVTSSKPTVITLSDNESNCEEEDNFTYLSDDESDYQDVTIISSGMSSPGNSNFSVTSQGQDISNTALSEQMAAQKTILAAAKKGSSETLEIKSEPEIKSEVTHEIASGSDSSVSAVTKSEMDSAPKAKLSVVPKTDKKSVNPDVSGGTIADLSSIHGSSVSDEEGCLYGYDTSNDTIIENTSSQMKDTSSDSPALQRQKSLSLPHSKPKSVNMVSSQKDKAGILQQPRKSSQSPDPDPANQAREVDVAGSQDSSFPDDVSLDLLLSDTSDDEEEDPRSTSRASTPKRSASAQDLLNLSETPVRKLQQVKDQQNSSESREDHSSTVSSEQSNKMVPSSENSLSFENDSDMLCGTKQANNRSSQGSSEEIAFPDVSATVEETSPGGAASTSHTDGTNQASQASQEAEGPECASTDVESGTDKTDDIRAASESADPDDRASVEDSEHEGSVSGSDISHENSDMSSEMSGNVSGDGNEADQDTDHTESSSGSESSDEEEEEQEGEAGNHRTEKPETDNQPRAHCREKQNLSESNNRPNRQNVLEKQDKMESVEKHDSLSKNGNSSHDKRDHANISESTSDSDETKKYMPSLSFADPLNRSDCAVYPSPEEPPVVNSTTKDHGAMPPPEEFSVVKRLSMRTSQEKSSPPPAVEISQKPVDMVDLHIMDDASMFSDDSIFSPKKVDRNLIRRDDAIFSPKKIDRNVIRSTSKRKMVAMEDGELSDSNCSSSQPAKRLCLSDSTKEKGKSTEVESRLDLRDILRCKEGSKDHSHEGHRSNIGSRRKSSHSPHKKKHSRSPQKMSRSPQSHSSRTRSRSPNRNKSPRSKKKRESPPRGRSSESPYRKHSRSPHQRNVSPLREKRSRSSYQDSHCHRKRSPIKNLVRNQLDSPSLKYSKKILLKSNQSPKHSNSPSSRRHRSPQRNSRPNRDHANRERSDSIDRKERSRSRNRADRHKTRSYSPEPKHKHSSSPDRHRHSKTHQSSPSSRKENTKSHKSSGKSSRRR